MDQLPRTRQDRYTTPQICRMTLNSFRLTSLKMNPVYWLWQMKASTSSTSSSRQETTLPWFSNRIS